MAVSLNPARDRLEKGELSLGMGIRQARTGDIAKAMKTCGYDWLFIDCEHNQMGVDIAAQIAVAGLDAGIAPIVRVPRAQYSLATRILDGGAIGVVMPHVDTAAEAAEVVDHVKYPPQGHRSAVGALPQFDFRAVPVGEATRTVNEKMLVVVMLETPQAIENAEAIAAVKGIDVLLIGTNDLALEHGIPGEMGHAKIVAAYETVIAACRKQGKWPGMGGIYAEDLMAKYIGMGMKFILSGNDLSLMMSAGTARAKFLRDL
jgi:2-keto-3-deoxy-L-rhamnonate aldolase RhmA